MSKPAAGATLDTGNALYSSMANIWAVLETSGSTLADSKGSNTITLAGDAVITANSGNPYVAFSGTSSRPGAMGSTVSLSGSSSWSIAWGGLTTTSGVNGMICGNVTIPSYIWMFGGNYLKWQGDSTSAQFGSGTGFTTFHDYLLVFDDANALMHLYVDGTELTPAQTVTAGQGAFTLTTFGNGYTAATFDIIGRLDYFYIWSGRVLTGTDAGTLHTDPYAIFATSGGTAYDLTQTTIGDFCVQIEGGGVLGSQVGQTCWYNNTGSPGLAVHFESLAGSGSGTLEAYVYGNTNCLRLTIDGVDQSSSVATATNNAWGWLTIATGLDTSAAHEYLLEFGTGPAYIQQLRTTNFTLNTAYLPARKVLIGFGDSVTAGDNYGTPVDATASWLHLVGVSLGMATLNLGAHSSEVSGGGGGATRTAQVAGAIPSGSIVNILYGTNDVAGSVSSGTFSAAYLSMIQLINTAAPGLPMLCQRLTRTSSGDTSRDTFSGLISTAVATLGVANCTYEQGMYNAYPATGGNGVHPAPAEQPAIAAAVVARARAVLNPQTIVVGGGGMGALMAI